MVVPSSPELVLHSSEAPLEGVVKYREVLVEGHDMPQPGKWAALWGRTGRQCVNSKYYLYGRSGEQVLSEYLN